MEKGGLSYCFVKVISELSSHTHTERHVLWLCDAFCCPFAPFIGQQTLIGAETRGYLSRLDENLDTAEKKVLL